MFITDNEEFWILYAVYIGLFLILLAGTIFEKKKKDFRNNLIFFSIYTAIMLYIFSDEDNFKGGSSLMVLFIGGVFILLHLTVFIIRRISLFIKSKQKEKNLKN